MHESELAKAVDWVHYKKENDELGEPMKTETWS